MRAPLVALLVCLAGCSHTMVRGGWDGTSASGGSVSVGFSGGGSAAAWLLIGIGLIAAGEAAAPPAADPPPQALDASRRVNEQDCTQPIRDWTANLKCR